MSSHNNEGYRKVFHEDDESLAMFLKNMTKFDRLFCDSMVSGDDFKLTFDIQGNNGIMELCKVKLGSFDRPKGNVKNIS